MFHRAETLFTMHRHEDAMNEKTKMESFSAVSISQDANLPDFETKSDILLCVKSTEI